MFNRAWSSFLPSFLSLFLDGGESGDSPTFFTTANPIKQPTLLSSSGSSLNLSSSRSIYVPVYRGERKSGRSFPCKRVLWCTRFVCTIVLDLCSNFCEGIPMCFSFLSPLTIYARRHPVSPSSSLTCPRVTSLLGEERRRRRRGKEGGEQLMFPPPFSFSFSFPSSYQRHHQPLPPLPQTDVCFDKASSLSSGVTGGGLRTGLSALFSLFVSITALHFNTVAKIMQILF